MGSLSWPPLRPPGCWSPLLPRMIRRLPAALLLAEE
jgi:hypothetical protein